MEAIPVIPAEAGILRRPFGSKCRSAACLPTDTKYEEGKSEMLYEMKLSKLSNKKDLWSINTVPRFEEQIRILRTESADRIRYRVEVTIIEGDKKPAKDIENYVKPIMDAVTYTQCLWVDDSQVDELFIRRFKKDVRWSEVTIGVEPISH